jgi:exosortase/archaeosortase family protein
MRFRTLSRFIPAILIAAAAVWLYAGTMKELLASWLTDGNYAHGIVVIPVALAIVYAKRRTLAKTPIEPAPVGNALIAAGLVVYAFSRWSDVTFLLRELAFPIAFLMFMTPPPDFFVEKIGAPLQRASCSYASMLAGMCGLDCESRGVMLLANGLSFEVDLPCSGIRAINCLTAFSAVLAYTARTTNIARVAIFLVAVPLAFAANVLRVMIVIVVANIDSVQRDVMRFHDFSGPVVFVMALAVVILLKRRFECSWRDGKCAT